jgi:small-conductance mechanosensitive channel
MSETTIKITVSGDRAAETLQQITAALPEEGVVFSDAATAAAPTFEALFQNAAIASAKLPELISAWFASLEVSLALTLSICASIFAVVYLMERAIGQVLLKGTQTVTADLNNLSQGVRWGLRKVMMLLAFYVLSRIGIAIALPASSEAFELASVALNSLMLMRAWFLTLSFLTAPSAPERRPTGLTDAEAAMVLRGGVIMLVFNGVLQFGSEFVLSVVDAGEVAILAAITMRSIAAVAVAVFFVSVRKPVGKLIVLAFAANKDDSGPIVCLVARFWYVIYILILCLQLLAETNGYLTGSIGEGASALKRSFGAVVLAPFFVAGMRIWRDNLMAQADGQNPGRIMGIFSLLEGVLIVGTGVFIMYAWNIDPFDTNMTGVKRILPGLVSAAIVTVIGVSIWRTANVILNDGTVKSEGGGPPEEEGGAGGSRIETVMPVLRAVTAAFIGTVTVLLALSSLGVSIAPLLAGAGILGLAIGFGAQKVVEDVISGVLYLVEDAFRKGEYIETAQGKGVVEAIMLRSVRLRHHLGPVFTIPFSSMGTIQNHSRDWVTVKLKFEVSPDQDIEKVRKLIKKVGVQLLEDPELEGQFLAPLKSQGAVALVGSNYQIGVKFTSEPGKQFLIRRKALNAIQQAFRENGIEMAAPRVIVDGPDQATAAAAKVLQDKQAQAAAGQ